MDAAEDRPASTGATMSAVVTEADTAAALGSGDVRVLGTPRALALLEAATVAAAAPRLEGDQTSVGTRVELDHLHPTPVGATVTAAATLSHVDGRRLTFAVELTQDGRQVARGTIVRVVVSRARFAGATGAAGGEG